MSKKKHRSELPCTINWRSELKTIADWLEKGEGGYVQVLAGPGSAPSSFLKAAMAVIRVLGASHLKLDPADETTHLPRDILARLEDWAGVGRNPPLPSIGTRIRAEKVIIDRVTVTGYASATLKRLQALSAQLKKLLRDSNLAIFVWSMDEAEERTRRWLWTELWEEHLSPLSGEGLFIFEWLRAGRERPEWEPTPMNEIILPAYYRDVQLLQAIRDVARLLEDQGIYFGDDAINHARTLLAAWEHCPSVVHSSLHAAVHRMRAT